MSDDDEIEDIVEDYIVDDTSVEEDKHIAKDALDGIDELKQQLEDMKRSKAAEESARRAAEDRARAREQEATQYKGQADSANEMAIENALQAATSDANRLAEEAKIAFEEGDIGKSIQIQRKLARMEARVQQIEDAKALYARQKAAQKSTPVTEQASASSDPMAGYSDKVKAWVKENPSFLTDESVRRKAMAAHNLALNEGIEPDSDQYFKYISDFIAPKKETKKPPTYAAPVTRETPSMGRADPLLRDGKLVVTAKMKRLAEEQGFGTPEGLKTWAKNYYRLVKAGEMEPI